MNLMIASGLDANHQIIPIAWALVPTEDKDNWIWFCQRLNLVSDSTISANTDNQWVIISDRDKGLKPAIEQVFPKAKHAKCCYHITDNMVCFILFYKVIY